MNIIKLSTLALFIGISTNASSQTLEQAVSLTIINNPEIKAAFNEYQSKYYEAEASEGAYLPQLDLDAGIGYESVDLASGIENDLTRKEATLSLTQLLWDGNATINDMSRTAADAESVRYQLISDASDMALEVSRIYLDSTKAFEVLQLSEANLAIHKEIHRDIKRRVESGIGSTADLSQVEARIAKAHGNLIAAQNNLFDVHTQFKRLVGQSPQGLIFPRADESVLPLTLTEGLAIANDNHPVIKIAQVDIDSARFQYQQRKGNYYPTISVEASQIWRDDAGGIEGNSDEFAAMLRLKYNLFNGGSDKDQAESAAYQLNKAKDFRDRTFRSVEEGLRLSWSALDLTVQQKEFLADHVDSASDTVIAYQKQYKLGKRTLLDVLNTENELFEARKGYIDSKYDEQFAKYRIFNATGVLLDALRVDTPKEWHQAVEY
ncbi:TolC family outer membrane protein [Vibrio kasasachensis]|uniref:TolC family outer membrane protein n=1 Tax=Vibrio kasasachensis TaxID=2910248 RepID=UPI003D0A98E1